MTETEQARRADGVLMAAVMAVGAVGLVLAMQLPPSRFDPLGPRSVPAAISALLIGLGALGLVKLWRGRSLGRAETSLILGIGEDARYTRHPWLAVGVFAAVVLYGLLLHWSPFDFFWLTAVFIAGAAVMMQRALTPRGVLTALLVGVAASGFLTYLFSRVLLVALP